MRQYVEKGDGHVRCYPFQPRVQMRNNSGHIEEALTASETQTIVNGLKGPSVLSLHLILSSHLFEITCTRCCWE